jgi:tetratricopeptide (TPR) repeat protein
VHLLTASETLAEARDARARGDVDVCLRLSVSALSQAEEDGDGETAFWSATAPGVMHLNRAEMDPARGHFWNAVQIALERGLTHLLGNSYHNLYLSAREGPDGTSTRRYKATAFELYRDVNPRSPRLAALMADWAEEEFVRRPSTDTAAGALQHWRACPSSLPSPRDRMLAACNQIVAAAWIGLPVRYREGLSALDRAFSSLPDHESAALALAHAATGSLRMRDYPEAASLAERALSIAAERQEGVLEVRAREVLNAALAERPISI